MTETNQSLFKLISQGVYIVGVGNGAHGNAFTAAWVMPVSFDPLMLALSINPAHHSYQLLKTGGVCAISVLADKQLSVAEHFGHSAPDKMAGFDWLKAKTGAPILTQSLAYFDCEVSHFSPAGDHHLAVCRVVESDRLNPGQPLLYIATGNMDKISESTGKTEKLKP
ncbi:MAG: flavin reductase [Gammaproteobacteria bacterium HGW-Gammaproteobacteria-3]|nr:MAG: flavin reductase [Gammaproteobacteria bacterium HGW-Gammaproteobacteria-3]